MTTSDRPTIEHMEWVFRHIRDHLREGGSFRYLIYDRMGFGFDAYEPLCLAGGMAISNAANELIELKNSQK